MSTPKKKVLKTTSQYIYDNLFKVCFIFRLKLLNADQPNVMKIKVYITIFMIWGLCYPP